MTFDDREYKVLLMQKQVEQLIRAQQPALRRINVCQGVTLEAGSRGRWQIKHRSKT